MATTPTSRTPKFDAFKARMGQPKAARPAAPVAAKPVAAKPVAPVQTKTQKMAAFRKRGGWDGQSK